MIALIRPEPALPESLNYWQSQGFPCSGVAVQTIVSIESALQSLQKRLSQSQQAASTIIVTSQYAAKALVSAISCGKITLFSASVIAIGTKTHDALADLSCPVAVPQQQDSEGVLAMPQLQQVVDQTLIIVKGEQGRDLLATTLAERGANVFESNVYQRRAITLSNADWQMLVGANMIVATNSEALELVLNSPHANTLIQKHWILPSARIAEQAKRHGINSIQISAGASDAALIKCIQQFME